jgi:N-methylhydantoinase A
VVGVDVGGTFTDLAIAGSNGLVERVLKVPSTPDDPSRGVLDALDAAGIPLDGLVGLLHGTTIATNAIIERTGARCALLTTRGFRDVLELGRRDRISLYGLAGVQQPLIARADRWEIDERIDYQGNELVAIDVDAVTRLAGELVDTGVEVVVIALLHSYADPAHERQVAEIVQAANPDWHVVTSSSVVTEYYEFERTSSATVHGYLQPLVTRYAEALSTKLAERGFTREALVMQSNGGVVPLRRLGSRASYIIRSGPAAGVMAACKIARGAGFERVITGDMGGTSFDVAVVIDGEPSISETTLLDFRVPLRVPMIDVHTIGAGGGSIVSVDRGGTLQVGPRSAGAVPGPVCFRRGGTEATVTDANVVLGRINADQPIGGDHGPALDVEAARVALGRVGERLGLGVEQTAEAVLAVVNVRMAGRMRLLSVERGHDPREFALVAFGGAGPLHAAALLREVGVRTLLVPANPGVLCAEGCIAADLRYDFSQTVERRVDALESGELDEILLAQADQGIAQLHTDDEDVDRIDVVHQADMAYLGQVHRLRVSVERGWDSTRAAQAFVEAYERDYGTQLEGVPILLVNARTSVRGVRHTALEVPAVPADIDAPDPKERRQVYFDDAWHDTPTYDRRMLTPGMRLAGPVVVEQADTTTVVEPGMSVWVDGQSNLQIEVQS